MSDADMKENIGSFEIISDKEIDKQKTDREKAVTRAKKLIFNLSEGKKLTTKQWEKILAAEGED